MSENTNTPAETLVIGDRHTARATDTFVGECETCPRPVRDDLPEARGDRLRLTCPDCGNRSVKGKRLYANWVDGDCDSRCMGALGPQCSCSCEGDNHGRIWAPAIRLSDMTADHVAQYQERHAAKLDAAEARRMAEHAKRVAAFDAWVEEAGQVELVEALRAYEGNSSFILDIAYRVKSHRPLSERQVEAVANALDRDARDEAERAEREAAAKPMPEGKSVTIEGTVSKVRSDETRYGPVAKMLVVCDGFKLWGTVPKSLKTSDPCGTRVRFVAEVTPRDIGFGLFKRPRQVEVVT